MAAVLLAGGAGRRFAGPSPKLLAPVRGRRLADHALDNVLAAGLDEVIVVTGAVELELPAAVTAVANPRWAEGMATSLQAGIAAAARHDAVVVGLADQPGVVAEAWRLVATSTATPIAVATYGGVRGHPVKLAAEVWPRLPTTGDTGARAVLGEHPHLVTEVPCPGSPGDVDTVEDLARWS